MTLSKKAAASTPRRNSSRFAAISSTSLAIHVEHNLAPPRVGIPNRHRGRIQRVDLGAGQVAHEDRFTWHDTVRRVSEGSEAECLFGDEGAVDRRGGLLTGHPVVIALKRSRASTRKRGESFSATVARLIEAGARAKRGRRSPRYISSGKALTSRAG